MMPQQAPSLDTTKNIEWNDADANGKFTGTKKVTAKIGNNTKSYTITICNAKSKEEGEKLLEQKIHEIVSVALMVNVSQSRSLEYKEGSYSTVTKTEKGDTRKKIAYLDGGYTADKAKIRTEKSESKTIFYEKILPIIKGRNSEIDNAVKEKIKKKQKLTKEDLKKLDPKLKVEYFSEETDISDLTSEIIEQKITKWKQAKQLAKISIQIFNLKAAKEPEKKKQELTPQEITEMGYALLHGHECEKNEEEGIKLLKEASEKGVVEADLALADYYISRKNFDAALEYAFKIKNEKVIVGQNILIMIYKKQNDQKKLLEIYDEGVANNNAICHFNKAIIYENNKNEEKAKEHFEKTIEYIDRPEYNGYNRDTIKAYAHIAIGNEKEAKKVLENAPATNKGAKELLAELFPEEKVVAE